MPTARLGAPPVRESSDVSPTCFASCSSSAGVTTNPHFAIAAAALCTVVPSAAAGALMAKYTPGVSAQAAMSAITATNDSMSIAP